MYDDIPEATSHTSTEDVGRDLHQCWSKVSVRTNTTGASKQIKPNFKPRMLGRHNITTKRKLGNEIPVTSNNIDSILSETCQSQERPSHHIIDEISGVVCNSNLFVSAFCRKDGFDPNAANAEHCREKKHKPENSEEHFLLDLRELSKTIEISGVKNDIQEKLLVELRCFGVILTESVCSNLLKVTYSNQSDCIHAYHSLTAGGLRSLCLTKYEIIPCVRFG
jgi:hypothetical protein